MKLLWGWAWQTQTWQVPSCTLLVSASPMSAVTTPCTLRVLVTVCHCGTCARVNMAVMGAVSVIGSKAADGFVVVLTPASASPRTCE